MVSIFFLVENCGKSRVEGSKIRRERGNVRNILGMSEVGWGILKRDEGRMGCFGDE